MCVTFLLRIQNLLIRLPPSHRWHLDCLKRLTPGFCGAELTAALEKVALTLEPWRKLGFQPVEP